MNLGKVFKDFLSIIKNNNHKYKPTNSFIIFIKHVYLKKIIKNIKYQILSINQSQPHVQQSTPFPNLEIINKKASRFQETLRVVSRDVHQQDSLTLLEKILRLNPRQNQSHRLVHVVSCRHYGPSDLLRLCRWR